MGGQNKRDGRESLMRSNKQGGPISWFYFVFLLMHSSISHLPGCLNDYITKYGWKAKTRERFLLFFQKMYKKFYYFSKIN